jgi:hypothetical protein
VLARDKFCVCAPLIVGQMFHARFTDQMDIASGEHATIMTSDSLDAFGARAATAADPIEQRTEHTCT